MKKGFLFSLLAVAMLASCSTESTEVVEETVVDTTVVVDESVYMEDEVVDGTSEEVKPEVE